MWDHMDKVKVLEHIYLMYQLTGGGLTIDRKRAANEVVFLWFKQKMVHMECGILVLL